MLLFGLLYTQSLFSQNNGLVDYFSLDSCNVNESQGRVKASSVGNLKCSCGIVGKSLEFNGGLNYAEWDSTILNNYLSGDFSISFYFKPEKATGNVDIFSKRTKCGIDSFFAIKYIADQNAIAVEYVGKVDNVGSLNAPLPANYCWFNIVFTKAGNKLTLYVNGAEKDSKTNNYVITVSNKGKLALANSPCLAVSDIRYKGAIDEIKIYNRALSYTEVKAAYIPTDKMITKDTVLLKGSSVSTRIFPTCATTFQWIPISGVKDPAQPFTTLSPAVTTTYTLQSTQGNCIMKDSIKVVVLDAASLDCDAVAVPNAFTPNNDGLNDIFRISNPYVLTAMQSFDVFDRWGERVFSTNDPKNGWDGIYKNQPLNPGIFVYRIKYNCKGGSKIKSGSFALIR